MQLRPYQQECIDAIRAAGSGSHLIQMATGLGKTVVFTQMPRIGRMLILSHREELVRQPLKYFDCSTSVEMAAEKHRDTEVVSASVQSIVRRLSSYDPKDFDTIIVDEAHHSAANTYRKVLSYFNPYQILGFTATPNRGDRVRLDDIYQDIIFQKDLRWGIENKYLSNIYCRRVDIGYDLSNVSTSHGDYAPGELDEAMEQTPDAIAEVYNKMAEGATLIFAVSVKHAEEIAKRIPGAVAVTGETKDRAAIIKAFTNREIPCLVNCMVFTEGTDMPLIETVIIARPTQSQSLYAQMVGRGLRLHPEKDHLNLIDCVGVSRKDICTAPSLLGIDLEAVPKSKRQEAEGDLLELPELVMQLSDCPEGWIRNVEYVDMFAKRSGIDTHGVNWFLQPDGCMTLSLPDQRMVIPAPDALGYTVTKTGQKLKMQTAMDAAYAWLRANRAEERPLWDLKSVKRWGAEPATEKQLAVIRHKCEPPEDLTKMQAAMILNRLGGTRSYDKRRPAADRAV